MLAVASPGSSFVVVSQLAMARSRRVAMIASLAMTVGALAWATAALFGLKVIFEGTEWLYAGLRIAGGLYLVWLGWMLWRHAGQGNIEARAAGGGVAVESDWTLFRRSLLVQLSNPKVAVFFGGIFLALLPAGAPVWVYVAALAIVCVNEFSWYALVATVFAAGPARRAYAGARVWIDRCTGGFLGLLGLKLALER
ncbi:MAG TPA: LysE family transporter [Vineibacter sp.]|nr:LysE family transporter [Vineibacter sp.]